MEKNKSIIVLLDYKSQFGSKFKSNPYRSGMDLNLLKEAFNKLNHEITFKYFHEIKNNPSFYVGKLILYTSSEDKYLLYKEYIEDIILFLENSGAKVIPSFKFLRANNNKVYMELLRGELKSANLMNTRSRVYGTFEELMLDIKKQSYPCVIKKAAGAMSEGVYLAKNELELIKYSRKVSDNSHFLSDVKDFLRAIKHNGYIKNSRHQNKFIVQEFIPNLNNDWKILIFHKKYFVLKRRNRKNDFRASGSGLLEYTKDIPEGILDFSKLIYKDFKVPNLSIDVGYNGSEFYLIEFQAIYFGTYTLEYADYYFYDSESKWEIIEEKCQLENEFAESVSHYINMID